MSSSTTDGPAGPVVVLVDRDGHEYTSGSAAEVSGLVYRQGYTIKDGLSFYDAVDRLGGGASVDTEPAEDYTILPATEETEVQPEPEAPAEQPEPATDLHD